MIARWPVELFEKLPSRVVEDMLSAMHYSNGERSIQQLVNELYEGEKQIWVHSCNDKFNATVVTQITQYPGKKTCEILYLGGDSALGFLEEISEIEAFAEAEGCDDIQVIGRKGWARALQKLGYDERYVVIGKTL